MQNKLQHYGQVNYFWHTARRLPVVFVPFGVAAVNVIGICRLVGSILRDMGMLQSGCTKHGSLQCAGSSHATVFLLDSISDIYQMSSSGWLPQECNQTCGMKHALQHFHLADTLCVALQVF